MAELSNVELNIKEISTINKSKFIEILKKINELVNSLRNIRNTNNNIFTVKYYIIFLSSVCYNIILSTEERGILESKYFFRYMP